MKKFIQSLELRWSDLLLLVSFLAFIPFLMFGQEYMQHQDPSMVPLPLWLSIASAVIMIGCGAGYLYYELRIRKTKYNPYVAIIFAGLTLLNLITIFVQPSKIFKRQGDTIIANVLVDPLRAICGGLINIPTPYGIKQIKIKPNTANGEQITFSNFGIKNIKSHIFGKQTNGDLKLNIVYSRPNAYNSKQLKTIEPLADIENSEVKEYNQAVEKELNNK